MDPAFEQHVDREAYAYLERIAKGTKRDAEVALGEMRALAEQRDTEQVWLQYGSALGLVGRHVEATDLFTALLERFGDSEQIMLGGTVAAFKLALSGDLGPGGPAAAESTLQIIRYMADTAESAAVRESALAFVQLLSTFQAANQAEAEEIARLREAVTGSTRSRDDILTLGRLLLNADRRDPDSGIRFEGVQLLTSARETYPDDPELLAVLIEHTGRMGASDYYDLLDELASLDPTAELVRSAPDLENVRATPSADLELRMSNAVMTIPGRDDDEAGPIVREAGLKAAYFPTQPALRVWYALGLAFIGEHERAALEAEAVASGGHDLSHAQHYNLATIFRMGGDAEMARREAQRSLETAESASDADDAKNLLAELEEK